MNSTPDFEIVQPLFLDKSIVTREFEPIYRTFAGGSRYYYQFRDGGVLRLPSVTSILSKVMPTSPWLVEWYAKYGMDRAKELARQAADYGTLMHIQISQYLTFRQYDLNAIPVAIEGYKRTKRISYDTAKWRYQLEYDMLAFDRFARQYKLKPIAISLMLMSPTLGFAGELDLIASIEIGDGVGGRVLKNGNTQRINVIIDFKSGTHQFYADNEAQLHMYKELCRAECPELVIDRVYNWSPKDRTGDWGFNFKDQTDSREALKIPHYVELFNIDELFKRDPIYRHAEGLLLLGSGNISCYKAENFYDFAARKHNRTQELAEIPTENDTQQQQQEYDDEELLKMTASAVLESLDRAIERTEQSDKPNDPVETPQHEPEIEAEEEKLDAMQEPETPEESKSGILKPSPAQHLQSHLVEKATAKRKSVQQSQTNLIDAIEASKKLESLLGDFNNGK